MRKLAFHDGYAIIVTNIRERASEYHQEQNIYSIKVVFRTAVGIKRFAEAVGEIILSKETKKKLLEMKKGKERVDFHTKIDFADLMMLNQPLWYQQSGISYDYMNTYEDYDIHTVIPTTKESLKNSMNERKFREYYENYHVGSTANGSSFKGFVNSFIKSRNVISQM